MRPNPEPIRSSDWTSGATSGAVTNARLVSARAVARSARSVSPIDRARTAETDARISRSLVSSTGVAGLSTVARRRANPFCARSLPSVAARDTARSNDGEPSFPTTLLPVRYELEHWLKVQAPRTLSYDAQATQAARQTAASETKEVLDKYFKGNLLVKPEAG